MANSDQPSSSDVESTPMPEIFRGVEASSKLAHNLLTITRKPTVGDMSCEDFSSLQRLLRVTVYIPESSEPQWKPDSNLLIDLSNGPGSSKGF